MKDIFLIITHLIFSFAVISSQLEEDESYFQLYPSENKEKPDEINFFNLKSEYYTINSSDEKDMKIINKTKRDENPIKNLSSIIKFGDRFLIKTCFGPDKIVEIKEVNSGEFFSPKDDYFMQLKKNLKNIKYCYSTPVRNPIKPNEYFIIFYWAESSRDSGIELYSHKYIIFDPSTKVFGKVKTLNSQGNNFYAQSCTNLLYKYIYCTIDTNFPISKENDFLIDSSQFLSGSAKINLITVLARFSNSIYHKPIGIYKEIYTNIGKKGFYFLTEYHDIASNKTRLMTSLYIHYYKTTYILRFDDLGINNGINKEDTYIDPNLFNYLLPNNEELIIIHIKKNAEGKNILSLNRYDYEHSLQEQTKFEQYSSSNYLRDDICENPKYMQSMFITPLINYDTRDKQIMELIPGQKYYKYQKDIGIVISCDKGNGQVEYQTKKIVMPQCLNILNQINGMEKNNLFIFTKNKDRVILDIYNNPNLRSFRNVEIQFFDSNLYITFFIIQVIQEGKRQHPIKGETIISNPEKIEFIRTMNYKEGKIYRIPYRIKISSPYYLTSDICYFEFYYEGEEKEGEKKEKEKEEEISDESNIKYCKESQNNNCIECNKDIIGIKLDKNNKECICDVDNGFNKEPNTTINMCTCKNGYSFYEGIKKCLQDYVLNNGPYCITGQDERSLIYIYGYMPSGMAKYYENGLPYCRKPPKQICNTQTWFKLGKYVFKSAKVNKCVYILYKNKIVIYSNKTECNYMYYDYKNCMNVNINNEDEYNKALENAYEYIPDDNNNSLIINESNITFFILNPYTSKTFSSVQLSPICIQNIKEINNLPSLLIFIANIKRNDSRSTQVEYSFFNPVPEFMNEELNITPCRKPEFLYNNTEYNNTLIKRGLQLDLGNNINNEYTLSIDEIKVNVQVNFTENQKKIIDELYIKRGIYIFDSSDEFFNDVCYMFSTPKNLSEIKENFDMYVQERRDIFYISEAICETGCKQIGYDKETARAVCKCVIKLSTEGFESVTFSPNEKDKRFMKKYILPNIRVIKCIFTNFNTLWSMNIGQVFPLVLLGLFGLCYVLQKYICFSYTHSSNNGKRKIYKWEEKLEELLDQIKKDDDNNSNNNSNNSNNNNGRENNSQIIRLPPDEDEIENIEEGRDKFRCKPENNENKESDVIKYDIKGEYQNDEQTIKIKESIFELENNLQINNKINNINNDSIETLDGDNIDNEKIISENKVREDTKIINQNNGNNDIGNNNFNRQNSEYNLLEHPNKENNSKKGKEKGKKKKKKENNSNHKPNPPPRFEENRASIGESQNSERENIRRSNVGEQNKEKTCIDTFYEKYYLYIYKKNTSKEEGLKEFKEKEKKCTFMKFFLCKYIDNSNLFFILSSFFGAKKDADSLTIKGMILILYIALFMFFNMFTEFNLSYFNSYIKKYKEDSIEWYELAINFLIPFFILYIPIAVIKKALSMTAFFFQEKENINYYKKEYKDKGNFNRYEILIQLEKSKIKKFRNKIDNNSKIIFINGFIFLFLNWVYAIAFFGIYKNSFECVLANVACSIGYTMFVSFILNLISTGMEFCGYNIKFYKNCHLSNLINCSWVVKFLSKCIFCLCRKILCCCCRKGTGNEENSNIDIDSNNNSNL